MNDNNLLDGISSCEYILDRLLPAIPTAKNINLQVDSQTIVINTLQMKKALIHSMGNVAHQRLDELEQLEIRGMSALHKVSISEVEQ